jgi:UDP-N-acetylmuramoyl-tripeptide--D-alanyl-D-alanine ligase
MLELWAAFAVSLAPWGAMTYTRSKRFLHILQLEEYFTLQYWRWLAENWRRYLTPLLAGLGFAISLFATIAVLISSSDADWAIVLAWGAAGALLWSKRPVARAKKPLVMTPRATRLLVTGLVLCADVVVIPAAAGLLFGTREAVAVGMFAAFVACVGAGHLLAVANLILYPSEAASRRRFEMVASRRLRERRPRIIAITGSAGKTTTKELVAHLLSGRFRVLKTPSSFNTPMGIARTVNDSFRDQEIFVVEMGAYTKGEIARLCQLVGGTDVSVITTVNAQHLERFGSLEKTAAAKWEIVEGLRPGGVAVLNFDVPALRDRATTLQERDVISFGVESLDADLRADNVVETPDGLEFDVTHDGETVALRSPLLARHNVGNILAAMAVGLVCGLDLGYIAAAVRQFRAPEHRLQPQHLPNGVVQIDDAYNANPEGIVGALEVLGAYAPKQRIVVTPGLIEMGSEKATYHAAIGRAAAQTVDVAVLVGPRQTADIKEAMLASDFPPGQIHVTKSFDEARELVESLATHDTAILYANDLPDQFDESLLI